MNYWKEIFTRALTKDDTAKWLFDYKLLKFEHKEDFKQFNEVIKNLKDGEILVP